MKQFVVKQFASRLFGRHKNTGVESVKLPAAFRVEGLEQRLLMAQDGPRILAVSADNRTQINFTFDRPIDQASLNTGDIFIFTAGKDKKLGTSDDVSQKISGNVYNTTVGTNTGFTINATLPHDTAYRVVLLSGGIKGTNGRALDGEPLGGGVIPTGNGTPGGNFDVVVGATKKLIARFATSGGNVDVQLYNKYTPQTVNKFLEYVNGGQYDTTFFHRLVPGFIIQGGGYRVTKHNATDLVANLGNIHNEPGITNAPGTIAMAKLPDQPNSATNQFFFNLANNGGQLDQQNGGFTVFGSIVSTDATSQTNLTTLGSAGTEGTIDGDGNAVNPVLIAGKRLTDVPMINTTTYESHNRVLNPASDLVRIFRVSILQSVTPTPGTPVLAAAVRAPSIPAPGIPAPSVPAPGVPAITAAKKVFSDGSPILA